MTSSTYFIFEDFVGAWPFYIDCSSLEGILEDRLRPPDMLLAYGTYRTLVGYTYVINFPETLWVHVNGHRSRDDQ